MAMSQAPQNPPAIPRPAATLLLLRDGETGLEILMIERHGKSGFASGATVFPGGRVDAGDHVLVPQCRGDAGPDEQALRIAAIRESYEESGVLLGRRAGAPALLSAEELAEFRTRHDAIGNFTEAVTTAELELATDELVRVAHWITPEFEPKRFDTHFFAAVTPPEQIAQEDGHEAVEAVWLAPQAVLDAAERGERYLMLPTFVLLSQFAEYATAADALAAERLRTISTVMPQITQTAEGLYIRVPETLGRDPSTIPDRYLRPR